jgi:poly(A) polymerase
VVDLVAVPPVAQELADRFAAAGHRLYVVGGTVRDALLGRAGTDLDFTTDARPDAVLAVVEGWANAVWDTGIAFGTVGLRRQGVLMEITTFRSDAYDRVWHGARRAVRETIEEDLLRRDFSVNAMAVEVTGGRRRSSTPSAARRARRRVLDTPATPRSRSPTIRCACCARRGSSRSWVHARRGSSRR